MEPNETYNVTAYPTAQQAIGYAGSVGSISGESTVGGLYSPSAGSGPIFTPGDVIVTRVAKIEYESSIARYDVQAAKDADTGVILLTIGCQSHPIQRWKRIGARLVQRNYALHTDEQRAELTAALDHIIDAAETALAD